MTLEEASSFKEDADEARIADDGEEGHAATARDPTGRPPFRSGSSATELSSSASSISYQKARHDKIGGGFWCGVLCMHLPGLSRRRSMQQQPSMSLISEADTTRPSTAGAGAGAGAAGGGARASTASMERFKYSSSSSGIVFERAGAAGEEEEGGEEEVSAYFDLPLELLRISSVDTESPVTAAFVFDGDRGRGGAKKKKAVPEMQDLDFSFPAPPDFSSPSSPRPPHDSDCF
ncbi:unnamed protein product [Urochloa decumbens]|uniref:Uncharacterized protein n=1 Tax=Urochloa decumbens TaxID=240449 RepID=A0ABC8YQ51_9POAL